MSKGKHLTEAEKEEFRKLRAAKLSLKEIARITGRSTFCIGTVLRGYRQAPQKRGSHIFHQGLKPAAIPEWKPPRTGSASGFIRPIDFDRLVAGRA